MIKPGISRLPTFCEWGDDASQRRTNARQGSYRYHVITLAARLSRTLRSGPDAVRSRDPGSNLCDPLLAKNTVLREHLNFRFLTEFHQYLEPRFLRQSLSQNIPTFNWRSVIWLTGPGLVWLPSHAENEASALQEISVSNPGFREWIDLIYRFFEETPTTLMIRSLPAGRWTTASGNIGLPIS
jgi:hypothetical protein